MEKMKAANILSMILIRLIPIIWLCYYDWKIWLPILLIILSLEKDIKWLRDASLEIIKSLLK